MLNIPGWIWKFMENERRLVNYKSKLGFIHVCHQKSWLMAFKSIHWCGIRVDFDPQLKLGIQPYLESSISLVPAYTLFYPLLVTDPTWGVVGGAFGGGFARVFVSITISNMIALRYKWLVPILVLYSFFLSLYITDIKGDLFFIK